MPPGIEWNYRKLKCGELSWRVRWTVRSGEMKTTHSQRGRASSQEAASKAVAAWLRLVRDKHYPEVELGF